MATETTDPGKSQAAATDVSEFITDLDGGQFERMLSVALSQSAAAAVDKQKTAGKPVGARLAIPLALRLEATNMTLGEVIGTSNTMLRALVAEVERLNKDAARYRFLRDADRSDPAIDYETLLSLAMESMDAAIDAAMSA